MSEEKENALTAEDTEKQLLAAMAEQMKLLDYVAKAGKPLPEGEKPASREVIIAALNSVSDPDIMINVWDMGLIYNIDIKENGNVFIEMTVTAPTCPVAGVLPGQAAEAVAAVKGVGEVEVKLVWEPAWTFERMSDEAKMMFEMF